MSRTTFITTCMGRLEFLKQSLPTVVAQPQSSCVVVDYSCPEHCGDWVQANFPDVKVVRVAGQTRFNLSAARNAGLKAASEAWVCYFDCDVLFNPAFVMTVGPQLTPGFYYCVTPRTEKGLWGTIIVARADVERAGGYDETYRGWGDDDLDFFAALEFCGVKKRTFPAALLTHLPHGDDLRTQFYDIKDRWQNLTINQVYRYIKWDITRLTNKPLSAERREELYRTVTRQVLRAGFEKGAQITYQLNLNEPTQMGMQLYRVVKYLFRREDEGPPEVQPSK